MLLLSLLLYVFQFCIYFPFFHFSLHINFSFSLFHFLLCELYFIFVFVALATLLSSYTVCALCMCNACKNLCIFIWYMGTWWKFSVCVCIQLYGFIRLLYFQKSIWFYTTLYALSCRRSTVTSNSNIQPAPNNLFYHRDRITITLHCQWIFHFQ